MFFQVQKLLPTCLDSFVLRRMTSSAMRGLSRLTPAGCVFFPIHRVHSSWFFMYDQLLQQQTMHSVDGKNTHPVGVSRLSQRITEEVRRRTKLSKQVSNFWT